MDEQFRLALLGRAIEPVAQRARPEVGLGPSSNSSSGRHPTSAVIDGEVDLVVHPEG